jgi:hypothetical protein
VFNQTFFNFFFAFVVIISLAFIVLIIAGNSQVEVPPVDNIALPQ